MSISTATVLRNEAGVHTNPGTAQTISTDCTLGLLTYKKDFKEVFIHWSGVAWVEDAVFNPALTNAQVALRVDNPCTDNFSYLSMPYQDYRLLQLCCINCPLPFENPIADLPQGIEGQPYNTTIQLQGNGLFSMTIVDKPAWMNIVLNASTGLITITGTPDTTGELDVQLLVNNCSNPANVAYDTTVTIQELTEFPLMNFADDPVPGLPFGMFFNDGGKTFVGNATTMQEAADAWNNDVTLSAIATAYTYPGSTNSIGLLNITGPLPDVRALRYWNVTGVTLNANLLVFLSPDTIVRKGDGSQSMSEAAPLGTYSEFGLNASTYGVAGNIPLVDITSVYHAVPLTLGVNYFYHNEAGEWAWLNALGQFSNNGGNVPPTVRHLAVQTNSASNITRNISLNNFLNKNTALANVEAVSFNGQPVVYDNTWNNLWPGLKTWQMIDTSGTLRELAALNISAATLPALQWICYRRNNAGAALTQNDAWFAALPNTLTKGMDMQGSQLEPSVAVDGALNALGTLLAATVPEANARISIIAQNAARTAASDAAVAVLQARPYTVSNA